MKIKDLIEKLQEFPENMEVVVDGGMFEYDADLDPREIVVKSGTSFTQYISVDGGMFEYDADLDPREIVVKSGTSFTQYISQKRYKQMCDDAEPDGSFVDEKVIYLG